MQTFRLSGCLVGIILSFTGNIMPKICGLLPPRIHQTSLLTGYFSAPDNTGTSLRGNEGFLCTFFSLFDEGSVCVCRGHLRSPSEAGGGGFSFCFTKQKFLFHVFTVTAVFSSRKKSGLRMHSSQQQQGRSGVRSAHWHSFTHLGAVQYHRCHRDFIDRPLAPAAEVSLSVRAPPE